jgi:S1-C subfamily serine protease
MRRKLLLILLCFPMLVFGQDLNVFNAYKYIVIKDVKGNPRFGGKNEPHKFLVKNLENANFHVINEKDISNYEDLEANKNLALYCYSNLIETGVFEVYIVFKDYQKNLIYETSAKSGFLLSTAYKKALSKLTSLFYEYDPNIVPSTQPNTRNNTEWAGNGSGFFISKSGYIVTNNHVIDGALEIEVEFKYKNQVEEFNAKVIKVDKTNDLAIIKIDDSEFSNLSTIPYNFKTGTIDIGSEVFALGYPMALSLMGKDIKFTNGRISSKTGLDGDMTTYQIQVPIQPGNSGGPLFDFKGNLIGITSSGINRKLDLTENVNYAIKSRNLLNLIEALPETITLPSSTQLASKPLTEQIKALSDYVVLIKVK